jgi:hypothetical protein
VFVSQHIASAKGGIGGGGFVNRPGEIIAMHGLVAGTDEQQIPLLRFASVGMTT